MFACGGLIGQSSISHHTKMLVKNNTMEFQERVSYGASVRFSLYPVMTGFYHLTGTQYNSDKTLMTIGLSLKVFVGMLSDCVPILGYCRKSWMIICWTCCLIFDVNPGMLWSDSKPALHTNLNSTTTYYTALLNT